MGRCQRVGSRTRAGFHVGGRHPCEWMSRPRSFLRIDEGDFSVGFRDVGGDASWQIECDRVVLGVIVRPYSVLPGARPLFFALPRGVASLHGGFAATSWIGGVRVLLRECR